MTAIHAARLPFCILVSLPYGTVRNRILYEADLQNKNVIKHSAIHIANYILQRGMPQPLVRSCFDSVSPSSNFCYWIPPATRHSTKTEFCNPTSNPQSSCGAELLKLKIVTCIQVNYSVGLWPANKTSQPKHQNTKFTCHPPENSGRKKLINSLLKLNQAF